MAFNKGDKADARPRRSGGMRRRKKVCVFCGDKNGTIDYLSLIHISEPTRHGA